MTTDNMFSSTEFFFTKLILHIDVTLHRSIFLNYTNSFCYFWEKIFTTQDGRDREIKEGMKKRAIIIR